MKDDVDVQVVVLNGKRYVMFDGYIIIQAKKLRDIVILNYSKWRLAKTSERRRK